MDIYISSKIDDDKLDNINKKKFLEKVIIGKKNL